MGLLKAVGFSLRISGIFALSLFMVMGPTHQAIVHATEIAPTATLTTSDTAGLVESDSNNSIIINSNTNGQLTFGAQGVVSLDVTGAFNLTVTVQAGSGINGPSGVVFADDVQTTNASATIAITSTNDDLTFQGSVIDAGGGISITGGGASSTLSLTFDTKNNENLNIDSTVTAASGSDTITLNVNNSQLGANTINFAQAIGSTAAIDILNVGASTTATFSSTVVADAINISSTNTTTFSGTVTGNIDFAADGTISVADNAGITGAITNTTANQGTLTLLGTTTVSGAVGSTGVGLKAINAGATGTATFSSAVTTSLLTTTGTGNITFDNAFTGDLNFANGAGATVTVANGFDFTGTITNTTTNEGTLTLSGTTTVSGAVGSTGAGLQVINAGTGTATFTSDVTTTLMSTNGSGNIALNGNFTGVINITNGNAATITLADGKNFTGTITNATAGEGTLNVAGTSTFSGNVGSAGLNAINIQGSGKTATFSGDLTATTTTISNLATLKFTKASTTLTGSLTTSGTTGIIDVGTTTVTASGTINFDANATFNVTIGDSNGQIDASTAGATLAAGTTINPTVSGNLTSGVAIVILKDNDGNIGATPTNITDNNSRFDFTLALNGKNLEITATSVSTGLSTMASAVNDVVDVALSGDTLLTELNGLSSTSSLNDALETLTPVVSGGAVIGSVSAGGAALSTVSSRTASLRTGISAGQGLSSGDELGKGKRFWLQGFGTYAEQDKREEIAGFISTTGGIAFGGDKQINNALLLGLAGSYAHTDVNTRLSKNVTTVNSYQGMVYGSYEFGKNYFLDAQAGFAYNNYDGERFITVGSVERTASADYEGYQVLTQFELGRDMSFGNDLEFTPSLGLSWTHVEIDDYTETGAGTSNLVVNDQDYDILNLTLRGELRRTWDIQEGSLTPEIHLGYNYEAIDDKIQTVSVFTGGGNTFTTTGFDPANHSVLGGLELTFTNHSNFDFIATYDLEVKDDFTSHSALLKGRWNF
jgi:outer membrane autotransporter protein